MPRLNANILTGSVTQIFSALKKLDFAADISISEPKANEPLEQLTLTYTYLANFMRKPGFENLQLNEDQTAKLQNTPLYYCLSTVLDAMAPDSDTYSKIDLNDVLKGDFADNYPDKGLLYGHLYKILTFMRKEYRDQNDSFRMQYITKNLNILYSHICSQILEYYKEGKPKVFIYAFLHALPDDLLQMVAFELCTKHNFMPDGDEDIAGIRIKKLSDDMLRRIKKSSREILNSVGKIEQSSNLSEVSNEQDKIKQHIDILFEYQQVDIYDKLLNTPLSYAIASGNTLAVEYMLKSGANPNHKVSVNHLTPLEWSVLVFDLVATNDIQDHIDVFKMLLAYNADLIAPGVLARIKSIRSLPSEILQMIANDNESQNFKQLMELIGSKKPIKKNDLQLFNPRLINGMSENGDTPLILAIKTKNIKAIKILEQIVELDPNLSNLDGNTPLHFIIMQGDDPADFCRAIRLSGTKHKVRLHIQNALGITQYQTAIDASNDSAYSMYKNSFSTILAGIMYDLVKTYSSDNVNELEKLLNTHFGVNSGSSFQKDLYNYNDPVTGFNLLLQSIVSNNMSVFKLLVKYIDLLDQKQFMLNAALLYAVKHADLECIEKLIDLGADVNCTSPLNADVSVLILAVNSVRDRSVLQLLIDKGADVNYSGSTKYTVLMMAAKYNHRDAVELLLAHGADKAVVNKYGDTALSISLSQAHHAVTSLLTQGKLESVGYTKLMQHILEGNTEIVLDLLYNKSYTREDINAVNAGGISALIMAVQKYYTTDKSISAFIQQSKYKAIIFKLIENGADVSLTNKVKINFLDEAVDLEFFDEPLVLKDFFSMMCRPEIIARNNGQNPLHLCFRFSRKLLYDILYTIDSNVVAGLINQLDKDGNSPLSYLLLNNNHNFGFDFVNDLIENYGAKFIRNHQELRTSLHIKTLLVNESADIDDSFITDNEILEINKQDEQGLTALHYACLHKKLELAKFLIAKGARLDIADNLGRTPVHYAAVFDLNLPGLSSYDYLVADKNGITPLILAYQHESETMITTINTITDTLAGIQSATQKQVLSNITNLDLNTLPNLIKLVYEDASMSYKQKLVTLSMLKQACFIRSLDMDICKDSIDKVAKQILHEEFSDPSKYNVYGFPPGVAIGIELEIPELPANALLSVYDFMSWFPTGRVVDPTVKSSALSLQKRLSEEEQESVELEFVSSVINDSAKYHMFLAMCEMLEEHGAKVNSSAGMHVHVNARGTSAVTPPIASLFDTGDPKWQAQELVYLKFLALNFISLEQLLRGFLREGELFEPYGSSYVETISKYRDAIINSTSIAELQQICSHTKTLDLIALDKHGTTEFRAHEGAVDPQIVNAWVEAVTRLSMISYQQALDYIRAESTSKPQVLEPKAGIEQLAYLLIAQRNYAQTWDATWGATKSANIRTTSKYPGTDSTPVQIQIQQSPFYQMLGIILQLIDSKPVIDSSEKLSKELQVCMQQHALFNDPEQKASARSTLNELTLMLEFMRDNPVAIKHGIDLAANRQELYNSYIAVIQDLELPYGETAATKRRL